MKNIFLLFALSAIIIGNNSGCKSPENSVADDTKLSMTVDTFLSSPEKWAGKDVTITGTVSHVCRHSGKKLFLFGSNPEASLKVNSGGNFSTFDMKYEGTDVEITGTVIEDEKIDANYLNEWEADIKKNVEDENQKVCAEDTKAISGQTNDTAKSTAPEDPYAGVKELRQKLEQSGKAYISIYAIAVKDLKESTKEASVN